MRASDSKISAGRLRAQEDLLIEVAGELDSVARIARTPIRFGAPGTSGDGSFVRLSDVADVRKGIRQPATSLAIVAGRPAVALGVLVRDNQRLDHWSEGTGAVLDRFSASLPTGVELTTVFQQNDYVESRLSGLVANLLLGGVAVIGVILVMMGWRSALIVGSALPLAALMVLTAMRFLEIPIHQMSVTGLIIALGLLIDNAIVIVDEVNESLRSGRPPARAVSAAVKHLALPLAGSTVTTACAFAPIALMPGPAGEFVGSIAISVILAIFSSLFLALTIVPAVTALASGPSSESAKRRWWRDGIRTPGVLNFYRATLERLFARPVLGIAGGIALSVLGFVAFSRLPEQFFPPADRDQFQIELELPSTASLDQTLNTVHELRGALLAHELVEEVTWFLGESAPPFYYNVIPRRRNTSSYAQALVQLRHGTNPLPVIRELQQQLDEQAPDCRVLVRQLEQGPPFDAPVELRLYGPDLTVLRRLGDEVRAALSKSRHVVHTRSDLAETVPKLSWDVDEEEARLAGLDHSLIAAQLNATLEGAVGGSVLEQTEELPVRVRVGQSGRASLDAIGSLDLIAPEGRNRVDRRVPVAALGSVTLVPQSASVPRFNGQRMNEVQAYVTAGVLPAVVVAELEQRLEEEGFEPPPGYQLELGGEAAKRNDAVGNLMANAGILMVLMVATLVLSYNSFRIAGIIGVVAVLSAGFGLGALWVFGYPFGFMAIVGTMGLIGVAINDTIVVLAAIREDEEARQGNPVAVSGVVVRSTRHVVATSLTTMAGFIPLLAGGGGFWPPLAVSIAGGVGGATLLALYFAPSAYVAAMCRGGVVEEPSEELPSPSEEVRTESPPLAAGV